MKKEDTHQPARESGSTAATPSTGRIVDAPEPPDVLTIVGIGASAGGLDALQKLLPGLPAGVGMAYVIVQHLAPQHISTLPDLLARYTDLAIVTITDGLPVAADTIYITPPNTDVALVKDRLVLRKGADIGPKPSIDVFFRSLAEVKQAHAVGIILSGTGSDGAHGIRAIKSHEGITMAQLVVSAKFDGMPRAAIETGLVDLVLPPEKIGPELRIALTYPHLISKVPVRRGADEIATILAKLHEHLGVDFSDYKRNTIHRRISRRMAIHKIEQLKHYIALIGSQPEELTALYKDMLISVTGFFRDGSAFEALATALRKLLAGKQRGDTFRAWVPGCATGEEAYSIAMLIADIMGEDLCKYRYQIFATDLDEEAVQLARKAVYPVATVMETDGQRFEKFFMPGKNEIAVSKQIRDMVILARHDLIKDTSFMHLDLISCRNLLIYINPDLQDKLLSLFHFSLNPGGLLFLGKSETVGQRLDLFKAVDMKWKIFQRRETTVRRLPELMQTRQAAPMTGLGTIMKRQQESCVWQEGDFFNSLMGMMDCCAVLIDAKATIHYIRGDINPYFKFPEGNVRDNLNAVELARPELRYTLQAMVHKVSRDAQTITSKTINFDDDHKAVRIKVGLAPGKELEGYRIIVFTPVEPSRISTRQDAASDTVDQAHIHELEEELQFTREHLQATIEELETSTEELQSLNEELQSSNEELQATNEEMETSNEELQASNEELNTVNDELRAKSEEATHLLDSLTQSEKRYRRLVDNMNEALMLCEIEYGADRRPTDLVIQQANRSLKALLGIQIGDLPLRAGAMRLQELIAPEMLDRFEVIVKGGRPQLFDVQLETLAKDLTLSVYQVDEGLLGMVCRDDTERKRIDTALRASEQNYRALIETANSIIIRWDKEGQIRFINDYGRHFFGYAPNELDGRDVMTLVPKVEKSSGRDLEALVRDLQRHPERYPYVPSENITKDGRTVWVAWTNKAILDEKGAVREILAIGNDITALKETEERLNISLGEKEILLKEIHHRVKNNMQVISSLVALQSDFQEDEAMRDILQDITHRVRSMAMVHEKLYQAADLAQVAFADYAQSLLTYLWQAHGAEAAGLRLEMDLEPVAFAVNTAVPCGLILNELVSNALKHAFKGRREGRVWVALRRGADGRVRLSVRDDGLGLPEGLDWRQADSLGLRLVEMLARQLNADIQATSGPGTEFQLSFDPSMT